MLKKIIIGLAVVFALFAAYVASRPGEFKVTRSGTIAAPPQTVFEHVNDFHKWDAWSPWAKLDPNSTATFEGPPSGTGASFKWSGNDQVGQGEQKIIESKPGELVRIELHFLKPFEATNDVEFAFQPEAAGGTKVTWTMKGKNNFIGKAISVFMDCDTMVGGMFEQGLANLKKVAEAGAPQA